MYPLQFWYLAHTFHQSFSHHMQRVEIVAIEAVFQFAHFEIVQSFKLHIGIGERLAQLWLILRQEVDCGLVALGIHDELGIVFTSHLGGVCFHKSWRRTADESSDARDTFILLKHVLY